MSSFLDLYEPLDIIGNGSFGIIRKVRRKSDGLVFARKELNFERMTERDRKQIVAEVNILKDLHHDHIVRYHDRYVDRDAGILYILMEYCGGGDLSTVIKQAQKHSRPIPEDTIWNYFLQILLALQHCHHPNGHGRSGSSGSDVVDGKERRAQILHRDLKPDNVFLDEANTVKLGDFGLSKALAQASFANTYVGTPYYMSPELMQEKAYDSKSDIWSLGCLVYELCALKPPFHEAKTHAELSICIRNGRIPPLPRGYSQSLSGVIKAMLNLNPAMRPSTAQLLQHERIELVFKVSETEKMLSAVKSHKAAVVSKERDILAREASLLERESHITSILSQKDSEIAALQNVVAQFQHQQQDVDALVREAVHKREGELRVAVMQREEEVAGAMARREDEIMEAVRKREVELWEAWRAREEEVRKEVGEEVQERVQWVETKVEELKEEWTRLEGIRVELEAREKQIGSKDKTPLQEVKNLVPHDSLSPFPALRTPIAPKPHLPSSYVHSAMKGVVLTATGEPIATPTPAELASLFVNSPKVGLNFTKIFDFNETCADDEAESPPPSPSKRERPKKDSGVDSSSSNSSDGTSGAGVVPPTSAAPPTRLRRPSIRTRPSITKAVSLPASASNPSAVASSSSSRPQPVPLPHPHLGATTAATRSVTLPLPRSHPSPEYDFADEENLPSPFLKRVERERVVGGGTGAAKAGTVSSVGPSRRASSANTLRAVAAANAAGKRGVGASTSGSSIAPAVGSGGGEGEARPALASARKATEEARKALQRP